MKKLFFLFLVLGISVNGVGQDNGPENKQEIKKEKAEEEKGEAVSRLTLGIGIGANHLFDNVYDYSLTTDSNNNLEITKLNRNSIVVSPVVVFRLSGIKMKKENGNSQFVGDESEDLFWYDYRRLSILLSMDLINIQSDKVSYNKQIDGGIGIGYSFSPNLMVGMFYEIKSYRQLREYVVEQYENKPIPNGTSFYNALDETNNNLYYNKQLEGLSLKLIFNFNTL